jgi:hypothetical protein
MRGSNGIHTDSVSNRTPYRLVQHSQLLHALLTLPQSYMLLATCLCNHKLPCKRLHFRHPVTDKPAAAIAAPSLDISSVAAQHLCQCSSMVEMMSANNSAEVTTTTTCTTPSCNAQCMFALQQHLSMCAGVHSCFMYCTSSHILT